MFFINKKINYVYIIFAKIKKKVELRKSLCIKILLKKEENDENDAFHAIL